MTLDELKRICPLAKISRLALFVDPLNVAMAEFEIDAAETREAMFLAHVAHESGGFRYMRELALGDAYEGRIDLGNVWPGDGRRFRGRGPIQITGRKNTRLCSLALYGDERLLDAPELLEEPGDGCRSAGWFWTAGAGLNLSKRAKAERPGLLVDGVNLNDVADAGDFEATTLAINGGLNGLDDRIAYHQRAQAVLV